MYYDPTLLEIANRLDSVVFTSGIDDHERAHALEDLRNVAYLRDRTAFRIRFYLAGRQRTIGVSVDLVTAVKFADCARLYLWQYRRRECKPPPEEEYHFSSAEAEAELNDNPELNRLLEDVVKHLDLDLAKLPANAKTSTMRQQVSDIRDFLADQQITNQEFATEIRQLLGGIVERLNRIETKLQ